MIVNQALRPLADGFGKKYPFVKMTYWRADSEEHRRRRSRPRCAPTTSSATCSRAPASANSRSRRACRSRIRRPRSEPIPAGLSRSRAPSGRRRGSAISASPTTPSSCRPTRCRRPMRTCSIRNGRARWPGASAARAARRCSSPTCASPGARTRRWPISRSSQDQKIVNFGSGSARTLVDRVIAGEYPIALNIFAHHPLISAAKGAPVNAQLMDPVPTAATMGSGERGAHPHAAMLLIDFILSKEGQEILRGADYFPADRTCRRHRCLRRSCRKRRRAGEFHRSRQAPEIHRQLRGDLPAVIQVRRVPRASC